MTEPGGGGLSGGHREVGEAVVEMVETKRAAFGDSPGRPDPLGAIGKARCGVDGCAQRALCIGGEQAPRGIEGRLVTQAGEDVVEGAFVCSGEAHISCGDEGDARGLRHGGGATRLGLERAVELP